MEKPDRWTFDVAAAHLFYLVRLYNFQLKGSPNENFQNFDFKDTRKPRIQAKFGSKFFGRISRLFDVKILKIFIRKFFHIVMFNEIFMIFF